MYAKRLVVPAFLLAAFASLPAAAAQRAYVSSTGNDVNAAAGCLVSAPCRSFQAAYTAVDTGGEIVALDAAGYGAVAIGKSVTITANPGFYAGIAASTGAAVTIEGASARVVLRGLSINGIGAPDGVVMTEGASLSIENCVISNFTNMGIVVSGPAAASIVDSTVRGNNVGIHLAKGAKGTVSNVKLVGNALRALWVLGDVAGQTTRGTITNSVVSGNLVGLQAFTTAVGGTALLRIANATISQNAYGVASNVDGGGVTRVTIGGSLVTDSSVNGFSQSGGAVLETLGNNIVTGNSVDISGVLTPLGGT